MEQPPAWRTFFGLGIQDANCGAEHTTLLYFWKDRELFGLKESVGAEPCRAFTASEKKNMGNQNHLSLPQQGTAVGDKTCFAMKWKHHAPSLIGGFLSHGQARMKNHETIFASHGDGDCVFTSDLLVGELYTVKCVLDGEPSNFTQINIGVFYIKST